MQSVHEESSLYASCFHILAASMPYLQNRRNQYQWDSATVRLSHYRALARAEASGQGRSPKGSTGLSPCLSKQVFTKELLSIHMNYYEFLNFEGIKCISFFFLFSTYLFCGTLPWIKKIVIDIFDHPCVRSSLVEVRCWPCFCMSSPIFATWITVGSSDAFKTLETLDV